METTGVQRRAAEGTPDELSDATFTWEIAIGALIGFPVVFAVLFALLALGTGELSVAPAVLWAAVVAGPYFGGFLALNLTLGRLEAAERAEREQARPRTTARQRVAHAV